MEIVIPLSPLSLNQAYPTNSIGKRFKSPKLKGWQQEADKWIRLHEPKLKEFERSFDRKKHMIGVDVIYNMTDLYTKAGELKKRFKDIDNLNKSVLDTIFAHMPMLDDSFVCQLNLEKRKADRDFIVIEIYKYSPKLH